MATTPVPPSTDAPPILPEADEQFLHVSGWHYLPPFFSIFIILTLLGMGVERQDEYGLQRVERLRRGSGALWIKAFDPSTASIYAEKLGMRPQELMAANHAVDRFLSHLPQELGLDWSRLIKIRIGTYTYYIGSQLFLNLAFAAVASAWFYMRKRRQLAEELIVYQDNKYQRVNRQLEAKMLEGQRIITKLNRLQDKLVESEKLASIGRMSATLAHEIRNPLSIIKSSSEMIAEDAPDNPGLASAVSLIRDEVRRMDSIITDLLNFARPKPPTLDRYMIKELVRHWLPPMVEELEKHRIQLVPQLELDGEVIVDPDQLWQVVLNIMWNARDALIGAPRPHVFVRTEDGGSDHIKLVIQDTGAGMLPETLRQIREPFFTTKTQGTGLGIPVSIQLIEGMGGRFDIESELDLGTKVTVWILRSHRAPRTGDSESSPPPANKTPTLVLQKADA